MVNIRIMKMEDYEATYALWLSCAGMGLNDIDDSKEGINKFLIRNPETCFVAEKDGQIVGSILASNDGRRGYIYHTAVKDSERHCGIATRLVNAALSALKQAGVSKASLVVFNSNADGNAFWEKQGFSLRNDIAHRNKFL